MANLERNLEMNKSHGSPWDRGNADSYYRRRRTPHYYIRTNPNSVTARRVAESDMMTDEVAQYHAGYDYNEQHGDYKDYE